MTEKRSSRIRKVHNYALLGDSDTEFFDDDEPVKFKKTDVKEVKPISKPSKTKKLTKDTSVKQCETIQTRKEMPPNIIINEAKLTTSNPSASHCEISESMTTSSHKASSNSSPSALVHSNSLVSNLTTPPSSNKAFFPVTPSSGLRLGLSRTKRLRTLHANVRIA
uniref:RAD51_interact domain-containing protein n=1 Tax=Schistosoma mansoni TaxID=6183 RepID=A0A3Q0KGF3_SCHMA